VADGFRHILRNSKGANPMTALVRIQISLCAVVPSRWSAARLAHDARLQWRAHVPLTDPARSRPGSTGSAALMRRRELGIGMTYDVAICCFSRAAFSLFMHECAEGCVAVQSAEQSAVAPDSFHTASASPPNTNWPELGARSTLSYLVQIVGLTHQNFPAGGNGHRARGRADSGFSRSSMRTVGNFGRST